MDLSIANVGFALYDNDPNPEETLTLHMTQKHHPISLFFVVAVLAQFTLLPTLWGHTSVPATVLGRYSPTYALALVGYIVLCLGWGTLALMPSRILPRLPQLPDLGHRVVGIMLILIAVAVAFSDIEPQLQQWAWLNLALGWIALALLYPSKVELNHWQLWGWVLVLVLFVPNLLTVVTIDSFNPDEAQWIDYGSSWFVNGSVYNSTLLESPIVIKPGIPWQIVPYAWLVEQFGNTVRVGRVVNLLTYYLAAVGLFLATRKLYDTQTASVATLKF